MKRTHHLKPVCRHFFVYLGGLLFIVLGVLIFSLPMGFFSEYLQTESPSNILLFLMLLPFAGGVIAIFMVTRLGLRSSFRKLLTSRLHVDWKRFFVAFCLWGMLLLFLILVEMLWFSELFEWHFQPLRFLGLLVVSACLIPIQAGFEELLFRGYLTKMIGVFTRFQWLPILGSSILFALMHLSNPEVVKLGYSVLLVYFLMGLYFSVVTFVDSGLELSMGMHTANNLVIALMISSNQFAIHTNALVSL